MTEDDATPRPWVLKEIEPIPGAGNEDNWRQPGSYGARDMAIVGSDGVCPGIVWDYDEIGRANALLIVRAVNAHAALVEKNDGLHRALATLVEAVAGEQEDPDELERALGKEAVYALEMARAALTKGEI